MRVKTTDGISRLLEKSNFDATNSFDVGDKITVEWKINDKIVWWEATIRKVTIGSYRFGHNPCRVYVLFYKPARFFPRGKLMKHFFVSESKLVNIVNIDDIEDCEDEDDEGSFQILNYEKL